jgi:hypothetical protein
MNAQARKPGSAARDAELLGGYGEGSLPGWQRLARRVLPGPVRVWLNHLNRARLRWQQKRVARPSPAEVARATALADPDGPYECPLCERRLRGFLPGGPSARPNAKCPVCGSLERHRAAWVYLRQHAEWLQPGGAPVRLLHLAPEGPLENRFRAVSHVDYTSADLEPGRAMVAMDLTDIDAPDGQYDVIYCSHVLEHIPDDAAAMREMHRVLKPGGVAYIQVPLRGAATYEDASITTPGGRKEAFGQEDHVRVYGADIQKRLEAAGFAVELVYPVRSLSSEAAQALNAGWKQCLIVSKRF